MLLKNKSNFCVIVKKRYKKSIRQNPQILDILLCKKSKHNKYFVIEKLGFIDYKYKKFCINGFRFAYWLQFNVGFSWKAWLVFTRFLNIINSVKIKKN